MHICQFRTWITPEPCCHRFCLTYTEVNAVANESRRNAARNLQTKLTWFKRKVKMVGIIHHSKDHIVACGVLGFSLTIRWSNQPWSCACESMHPSTNAGRGKSDIVPVIRPVRSDAQSLHQENLGEGQSCWDWKCHLLALCDHAVLVCSNQSLCVVLCRWRSWNVWGWTLTQFTVTLHASLERGLKGWTL